MDRGCLSITTKVLATQEDTTVLKLHITNKVASNDINKKLMEPLREMGKSFLRVGGFDTPLSLLDDTNRFLEIVEVKLHLIV